MQNPKLENGGTHVLDHGLVRLIDYMGSDVSVVRAARVSYDAASQAGEDEGSDAKLIRYLWRNHHTTPFEAVTFTFEVKAPIFVFRQWHRHRTWSFNELSARYKELPEECYLPDPHVVGEQSKSSKQARVIGAQLPSDAFGKLVGERDLIRQLYSNAFLVYKKLMAEGWPRELARAVLPLGTYSHMFATVNLLNLFKFLTLRTHEHAQYEIRAYALAMLELIRPIVPVCVSAWENKQPTVETTDASKA